MFREDSEIWAESRLRNPNRYADLGSGVYQIGFFSGHTGLIDAADFPIIRNFHWSLYTSQGNRTRYTGTRKPRENGRSVFLCMHRMLLDAPPGLMVDHKDGNGLNNCRANLRICTNALNQANRTSSRKYKGVSACHDSKNFQAAIRSGGKQIHLGSFPTQEDAARAYDAKALELFGEFAKPNFPA